MNIPDTIKQHIHRAIGAAAVMCWNTQPQGTFQDHKAQEIAERVISVLERELEEMERAEHGEKELLHRILRALEEQETNNKERHRQIMASQAEIDAALQKIDVATNKLATNVQTIADTDQAISDEIDKFLAANPVGTVLSDAQVTQLTAIADKAQATSDASDAQVAVLKAIATKGAGNPVPVPVPPVPPAPPTP